MVFQPIWLARYLAVNNVLSKQNKMAGVRIDGVSSVDARSFAGFHRFCITLHEQPQLIGLNNEARYILFLAFIIVNMSTARRVWCLYKRYHKK